MTGDKTMDTTNGTRARMPVGDLRSALPKLAVLLALLAALMAWSGIRQWRDVAARLERCCCRCGAKPTGARAR